MSFDEFIAEVVAIKNSRGVYEDTDVYCCIELTDARYAYVSNMSPSEFALEVDLYPIRHLKTKKTLWG